MPRTKIVPIRFTESEHTELVERAGDKSVSDLIRRSLGFGETSHRTPRTFEKPPEAKPAKDLDALLTVKERAAKQRKDRHLSGWNQSEKLG